MRTVFSVPMAVVFGARFHEEEDKYVGVQFSEPMSSWGERPKLSLTPLQPLSWVCLGKLKEPRCTAILARGLGNCGLRWCVSFLQTSILFLERFP